MGFIFSVPILFIVALGLGVLGVNIVFVIGIIRWGCILLGAFISIVSFQKGQIAFSIIMLIFGIGIIILGINVSNYLDSLVKFGELSIFDILSDMF